MHFLHHVLGWEYFAVYLLVGRLKVSIYLAKCLLFPNRPELFALASSALDLALDYFYVLGSDFSAAFLADKYLTKFPCLCFWELDHFTEFSPASLPYHPKLPNT